MENFSTLIWGLVNRVNDIHKEGMDLKGEKGKVFFVGDYLEDLKVNEKIVEDVALIAASSFVEEGPKPGDGSNALEIAKLRNSRINFLTFEIDEKGGTTFENFYKDIISSLGVNTQESQRMVENQEALLGMMNKRKDSISGVSLDEELANMIQFQLAYQASARVISTLNQIYDTIINRM